MKLSARNVLKAKVKAIEPGSVNSEITVTLPGGMDLVSVITKSSSDSLNLQVGKDVYVIIKASNVMIGVD